MTRPSWTIEHHAELESTNDRLKEAARHGAAGRLVVVAARQTAGRGRGQKTWSSPEGGLYASVLLREIPADLHPLLGFVAGEALCRTLSVLRSETKTWLKWPNDLLVGASGAESPAGKAAGILVESVSRGERLDHAIIGIGINLTTEPDDLPKDQDPPAVSLSTLDRRAHDRDLFLDVFLTQLAHVLTYYARAPGALVQAVQRRLAWAGEKVVASLAAGGTVEGTLRGLTPSGGLRIETSAGEEALQAWDVSSLDRAA